MVGIKNNVMLGFRLSFLAIFLPIRCLNSFVSASQLKWQIEICENLKCCHIAEQKLIYILCNY